MKRCFSRYRLALFALSVVVSSTIFADQVWKGASGGNVIDENLIIKGDVLLQLGATTIEALHRDVTVTLTQDATISGHWAGESQLYLIAAEGRTIRFEVDHNITFVGSSQITGDDLLTVQSGPGVVEVAIAEGKKFKITSDSGSGGVQWYVLMYGGIDAPVSDEYTCADEYSGNNNCPPDEYASGGLFNDEYASPGNGINEDSPFRPRLRFTSLDVSTNACNKNRQIIIGAKSVMSFLSSRKVDIAQDSAFIEFDAAMSGLSRMVLKVLDTGAFIAAGHYTCQKNGGLITTCNINRAVAAGFEAVWSTSNSLGSDFSAGLLVLDYNETLSELLADPFLNLDTRNDLVGYRGLFSGTRYGVVLGANGILLVGTQSYVDFVGLALNQLPDVIIPGFETINTNKLIKPRNASAFIIDGNNNPNSMPAKIQFETDAALFLRSGIADNGEIRGLSDIDPFTIDPAHRTCGAGNIVFDLEGALIVNGSPVGDSPLTVSSKIELLSLEVEPTGGPLFVGSGETNFPLRTFNTEDNALLMYNSGAFLINNMMSLFNTALSHTDEAHRVFPNNDLRSEPAYIGGETFRLLDSLIRPNISFFNSYLLVHTNIALTGLDLVVPNLVVDNVAFDNLADFVFYANGACVDNGTGRQMILGTRIGSTAADGCSRIDGEAYLDVMERYNAVVSDFNPLDPNGNHTLILTTAANDATINNQITTPVLNNSIHTIFLGGNSNISIGVNADTTGFNIDTNPWLRIQGNVFSFQTKLGAVARSVTTGKNAIFVDLNGKISIDPGYVANFGVMVIKSHNGIVDLPADQVFFSNGAGIATWDVDLSDPADQIIVGPDQSLSTYFFNWFCAKKDCPDFTPFSCCAGTCICPPVTEANITGLPTIQGTIDDLQIQGTRIGDPAQFLIDGGLVRHLTFSPSGCDAEAPVAVIVLTNGGSVGLDSTTTLGVNGVTIIADGSGTVDIDSDIVINNNCSLVKGPNFAACDVLRLYSAVPRQILLKSTGILNLTSFNDANDIVQIAGDLRLVVEPGATIITGAGTLSFADNAQLLFEPSTRAEAFFAAIPFGTIDNTLPITTVAAALPHNALSVLTDFGTGLHNTDQFRVKIAGPGTIEITDNAKALLPFNAFVGIESINAPTCSIPATDLTIVIRQNGAFEIGDLNYDEGGVLQVGNVDDVAGDSVNFTLTLDGADANFTIGSRGFFGLGVGIERFYGVSDTIPVPADDPCFVPFVPNNNIVGTLSNVNTITFNFFSGRFEHDRIFSGDDINASLIAIDADPIAFNLNFATADENTNNTLERVSTFNLAGGGNIVIIQPVASELHPIAGLQPVVLSQDGVITPNLSASIMASTLLQLDNVDVAGLTGAEFFDYFKTHDATLEVDRINTLGRANAASQGDSFRPEHQNIRVDTVSLGVILRIPAYDIGGLGQNDAKRRNAIDTAAVFVNIDPVLNQIVAVSNIEN
jgi:hypothetical protein